MANVKKNVLDAVVALEQRLALCYKHDVKTLPRGGV
jgi:hypothetical protein